MEKVKKKTKNSNVMIPVIAVLIALVIGAIVMVIGGYNPLVAYQSLVTKVFGSVYDIGETIRAIIPLLLSGLAVAVANKAGVFNIGVDGQIIMGAVSSLLVGTLIEMPPILHGIVAIFVGVVAGGLWGVLVAGLKTKFGINEVISSIMLNYIALYFSHILIKNFAAQEGTARSAMIKESAGITFPSLNEVFDGARIHWGFFLVPFIIFAFYYFFEKTRWGYETKVVGLNPNAASYAGIRVNRIMTRTMFLSGALGWLDRYFGYAGCLWICRNQFLHKRYRLRWCGHCFVGRQFRIGNDLIRDSDRGLELRFARDAVRCGRAERNHRYCDLAYYFLCGSTRNRQSIIAKETIA